MNDNEHPFIIATDAPQKKNNFPIVAQLGVLLTVLAVIFSAVFFQTKAPAVLTEDIPTEIEPTAPPLVPQKIEEISLRGKAAYVWDVKAQRVLYSKNATEAVPLASITKLMTALLAYELIDQNERATIPLSAIQQEGSSGLSAGEKIDFNQLSELALVSSSNDAAYALAANVGALLGSQDPAAQFIRGMNIRAEELNLDTLVFKSTTGLDLSTTEPGAMGSARDVTFLMEYIITHYPEIITPTQQASTRIYNTAGAYHEVENTNEVALDIPNMIGSKTGYTDLAGGNLTIAFDVGMNRPIIITVLGSTHDERFSDVMKLVTAVQQSVGSSQ